MKKYKVGDTIYVKGTVSAVDDTTLPYCVDFVDDAVWISSDEIIDELPTVEPVKPILPKKVADEMKKAKGTIKLFDIYIQQVIRNNPNFYPHSSKYWYDYDGNNTETLLNAWNNGYTVKKEPVSLVYVPGTNKKFLYNKRGDSPTRAAKLETQSFQVL